MNMQTFRAATPRKLAPAAIFPIDGGKYVREGFTAPGASVAVASYLRMCMEPAALKGLTIDTHTAYVIVDDAARIPAVRAAVEAFGG